MLLKNTKIFTNKDRFFVAVIFILVTASVLLFLINGKTSYAVENSLLPSPWHMVGDNEAVENYQQIDPNSLQGKNAINITYNLHGTCLLGGDASAIIFDQPTSEDWHFVSLADYGKNCFDGEQTVQIPLKNFSGLDLSKPVALFHVRFWSGSPFTIDLISVTALTISDPSPSVMVTTVPTSTPLPQINLTDFSAKYWNIPTSGVSPTIPASDPTLTRVDHAIDFNWDESSPDPSISTDHFAAEWTKEINLQEGSYHFMTSSDDGVRLWVDNQLLIDQWNDHPVATYSADKQLSSGTHTLKIDYYDNTGKAEIHFSISSDAPSPTSTPVVSSSPTPSVTATPTTTPTPTPDPSVVPVSTHGSWSIESVDAMKETKDKICGQDSSSFINTWITTAKSLGVNYIAISTPYDSPSCGNSTSYTKTWVDAIRSQGLSVWHRHMPMAFEGIYNTSKSKSDFLNMISSYIKDNPSLFQSGDIFTPIPEPQNGGINGVTGCANNVCQFDNAATFNQWLRDAMTTSENAFASIGLGGKIKVGYFGFDGFITWGDNNPDWHGILEDATVKQMGNITIDHYPELINETMKQGLDELQTKYPNIPIVIGEWGSAGNTDPEQQVQNSMGAAKRPGVVGFNYWEMGMGGNEALINSDFSHKSQFKDVQSFFGGSN